MPTCLLDKSVTRRMVEGLCRLEQLTSNERLVLNLWYRLYVRSVRVFVPVGVINILQKFKHISEVNAFLAQVEPLWPTKYMKRWARRLRQYGFTREDALILALATYGTDYEGKSLGVGILVTMDESFIRNFLAHQEELRARLTSMTSRLLPPYSYARLPEVLHPRELLNFLKGEDL